MATSVFPVTEYDRSILEQGLNLLLAFRAELPEDQRPAEDEVQDLLRRVQTVREQISRNEINGNVSGVVAQTVGDVVFTRSLWH